MTRKKLHVAFHFPNDLERFKRRTAVILPKDAGAIVAYANLNKKSKVVEIGGGSGFLTYYLANVCKKVTTYEKKKEAYEVLRKNMEKAGLKNVIIKNKDGIKIDEKLVDALIIDSPEATEILANNYAKVRKGGFIVAYIPNANQVKSFVETCKSLNLEAFVMRMVGEEWDVEDKKLRPKHIQLYHTAFLVFAKR